MNMHHLVFLFVRKEEVVSQPGDFCWLIRQVDFLVSFKCVSYEITRTLSGSIDVQPYG
jgi:hypothetical protein